MVSDSSKSYDTTKIRLDALSEYKIKAEMYIISLTFTILALSIQFAIQDIGILSKWLEIAAWILLVTSGGAGILMLRNVSYEHDYIMAKALLYEIIQEELDETGKKTIISEGNKIYTNIMDNKAARIRHINRKIISPIQGYFLLAGLSSLVAGRIAALFNC